MLAKEFDAYAGDDLLTSMETMGERSVRIDVSSSIVDESGAPADRAVPPQPRPGAYPLPNLDAAQSKGRYIQFLEQAFEWDRLGYVCYPYFWATPPKWMELLTRSDDADPEYTAFLRAGRGEGAGRGVPGVRRRGAALPGHPRAVGGRPGARSSATRSTCRCSRSCARLRTTGTARWPVASRGSSRCPPRWFTCTAARRSCPRSPAAAVIV